MQFECKTLTPLFSGGPLKDEIEFRPHIIKSSMRYWWRALNAHLTVAEMYKEETRIFGMGGENAVSSSFSIRDFVTIAKGRIIPYPKLPHHDNFKSNAFTPNSEFEIDLEIKNISKFNYEKLNALMQITASLGNLGNRARRVMGAWQIIKNKELNSFEFNLENLLKSICLFSDNYVMSKDKKWIGLKDNPDLKTKDYPYIKKIYFDIKKTVKLDDFLYKVMEVSHCFKFEDENVYSLNIGDHRNRLASPVYISIVEIGSEYYPIITRLNNPRETNNDFVENYIKKILE